ncbi:MAG TPA: ABC transporter permease [Puia sp.]|nr:ABC transporter permease [Puia sp.]
MAQEHVRTGTVQLSKVVENSMNKDNDVGEWDLVITPEPSLFNLNLKDLWRYRDLLILFVKRDFTAQYKQTILGPIWHLVQPALTTAMFLLLFSKIARIPTDGIQPVLFYMSGITVWNYFSACVLSTSNTFVTNAAIFGKVYFPRLVIPLSIVLSNIIRFGIQFGLLLGTMVYYQFKGYPIHFSFSWLYIPVLLLLMAGIGLGCGIIISSLTTKYRDLTILITFAIQLLMYMTPVAYPLSFLNHSKYQALINLNPITPIVEVFRYIFFGAGTFTFGNLLYSAGFMVVALFLGLLIFNKVEKTFMDTV